MRDRIHNLKDTGAGYLSLHAFSKNQTWLEFAQPASVRNTWTQILAFEDLLAWVWGL